METSKTIRSHLTNIRYYANEIKKLTRKQFDDDYEKRSTLGGEVEPTSIRFCCISAMDIGAEWILIYCDNIEANLKKAEEQEDKMTVLEV